MNGIHSSRQRVGRYLSVFRSCISWDEIKSVLEVMEAGDWTSVYTYDHFVPPWGGSSPDVRRSDSLPTGSGPSTQQ